MRLIPSPTLITGEPSSPKLPVAAGVFRYDLPGGPVWAGLRWEGGYQVVYFAFGFEGIGDQGAAAFRFKVMKTVFNWFDELPGLGDLNCDGYTNFGDINPFVLALSGQAGYYAK